MKTKFIILSTLFAAFFCAACSDDMESKSVKPTFSNIEVTPNTCNPGETVSATVNYKDKGAYFYFYSQIITMDDSIVYKSESHTTELPKNVKIIAPSKPGSHIVKYSSKVSYTSGTKLFDETESVQTTLNVVKPEE